MFDINPGLGIWTFVVFILLVIFLGRVAWKPLIKALQDREESIRDALASASKARAEATALLKENEQNIARAEEEYRKTIRAAKLEAEKMKEELLAKAQQQAQRQLQQAKEEIQRDVEAAKQQLRSEVADLAIKAAEKILEESIDEKKHKQLVDGFLGSLPKS
ncbi:MAG: F0F1 ATP synthase subunit B [Ignavibacteria bacterium]|nr:F0F1 ATP synthase subunit B [Ignavibacteria bacterium]